MGIVLGVVAGIAGSIPLLAHGRIAKAKRAKGQELSITFMLGMVMISLAFLSVALIVCRLAAQELLLPFAIAMIAAFLASVSIPSAIRIALMGKKGSGSASESDPVSDAEQASAAEPSTGPASDLRSGSEREG